MEEKETKKFELNSSMLENFDEIMSTKLDEIEELKIVGLDKGAKLLNIISLCANVKTLILDCDSRINSDKILSNIFKPEKIENITFNNIKLPKASALKKYTAIKTIVLSNIKIGNINEFFEQLPNPKNVEKINLINIDMQDSSINIFQKFSNLKLLNIANTSNLKLDDLEFLKKNNNLSTFSILNNSIPINQVNNLLKIKGKKDIILDIINDKQEKIENLKVNIKDEKTEIHITLQELEEIAKDINLYKVDKINIIINSIAEKTSDLKLLRKLKKEINIILKDFSCLKIDYANKMKELIKLEKIILLENDTNYTIDSYIEMRQEIDKVINRISKHVSETEKFLEIYKFLGTEFKVIENAELDLKKKVCNASDLAHILKNCLQCINIESNIIVGDEVDSNKTYAWNQVKIGNKWYNVDLSLDIKKIKKRKSEYCLLGDKSFMETHTPRSGKNNYCPEDFNPKLVKVFFKTGLFKEKLLESYLEVTIEKLKKMFKFKKKAELLALPSGENGKIKKYHFKS